MDFHDAFMHRRIRPKTAPDARLINLKIDKNPDFFSTIFYPFFLAEDFENYEIFRLHYDWNANSE